MEISGTSGMRVRHIKGHVCARTGNVFFNGDVQVDGDVLPGFRVDATGDVVVKGRVRGAIVRAGGSVLVRGAIGGDAKVAAGTTLRAGSADHARLVASREVRVAQDLLFCQVECDGAVEVGGRLIGGTVVADEAVRARAIGCRSGIPTRVLLNPMWRRRRLEADCLAAFTRAREALAIVRRARGGEMARAGGAALAVPAAPLLAAYEERLSEQMRSSLRYLVNARRQAADLPVPAITVEQAVFAGAELQINEGYLQAWSQLPPGVLRQRGGSIVNAGSARS